MSTYEVSPTRNLSLGFSNMSQVFVCPSPCDYIGLGDYALSKNKKGIYLGMLLFGIGPLAGQDVASGPDL